ncbi:uncharacterized protein LOC121417806 [Lytechinus variegatus]|uniref:uncharacterized protein LOC121417806 n=1 Tax=Lytechinus variegatus TaxID=7654 RepID=UPI001BB22658|nr:uncharacterized protein LOC121417806 [Lytechinus variegatus]
MKRMKNLFLAVGLSLTLCFFCKTGANQLHSCESRCGDLFDKEMNCQCNYKCVTFNNCCNDFLQKCTRIHFAGATSLEGLVIVQEKTKTRDVGFICHGGRWLTWEASAACAHLGYSNNGSSYSTDTSLNVSMPILHSYASCGPGARNLSQCTFTTNITTQDLCSTDSQVDCCKGLLGLTCIDDSDGEKATVDTAISTPVMSTKTHSSTVLSSQSINTPSTITEHTKINEGKNDMYIYIIIGVAVVLLLIIVVLIVMARFQRKSRQRLRDPPAFGSPLVTMGNVTSDQSEDTTPTPLLARETLCVKENAYASDPTLPPSMPGMANDVDAAVADGEEHEYAYMDMPPIRSGISEDPVHTYMDTEVSLVTSRPLTCEQNDDGLIDNVLYQTSN